MIQVPELEGKTHLALKPIDLIDQGLRNLETGYLKIKEGAVTWFIYMNQGKLLYITHSVDPIDRLDCHLRGLSRRIPELTAEVRTQIRLSVDFPDELGFQFPPDYQGIALLVQQATLNSDAARELLHALSKEALELLLLLPQGESKFVPGAIASETPLPSLNLEVLYQQCQERFQVWKSLAPYIISPYQRPYLFSQVENNLSPERQQKLGKLLKGYCFRHLAILMGQDELRLVKSLYPLILDKSIILREPQPPYHVLPSFAEGSPQMAITAEIPGTTPIQTATESLGNIDTLSQSAPATRTYRVACIDDSAAMLQTIEQFLGKENIELFLIQDSVKALVELMRIKPDLVLLDVGMPRVDGYELCRLLRKHPLFKKTPIIMVTGNTGLIDRAKAKVAGTTDYMTKPFTQSELLKMVFRHLD